MNSKERFEQLFRYGKTEGGFLFRPILMHFAARYIGETYRAFASDYRVLVESNIRCMEDFNTDAVGLISDPYRETSAFGAKVTFPEDSVPRCLETLIKTQDDICRLKIPDVYQAIRTRDRIDGARMLSKEVGSEVPVIGWVEGHLAEACDLAGVNEILMKIILEPDFVKRLIDKVNTTAKAFAKAQIDAGCDIVGVGDAICSQISAENYREFVKEKHRELFDFIHQQGARVKLHICGNITHLLNDIKELNPDIVDIDHLVDMEMAFNLLGTDIVRCGNLDPVSVIQQMEASEVKERIRSLCDKEKGRRYIISGGCEITVNTPLENLRALGNAC